MELRSLCIEESHLGVQNEQKLFFVKSYYQNDM